jgi:hypothetical protein
MTTVLVIACLVVAIVLGAMSTRYERLVGVALAFLAAAFLVPHLGLH